jgi:hypothetical protein
VTNTSFRGGGNKLRLSLRLPGQSPLILVKLVRGRKMWGRIGAKILGEKYSRDFTACGRNFEVSSGRAAL